MNRLSLYGLILILLSVSCFTPDKKVMLRGEAQGTYYAITYFDRTGRNFQPEIDSILRRFDLSVSLWEPASILSRINNGDSTTIPDEWFTDIFNRSVDIAEKTGGAFDFTVGPLVNAWGFGFRNKIRLDSAKVDSLRELVDYRTVGLYEGKIVKRDPRVQFDFNAIAQGYAVDVLGNFLASEGISNFLIDIGGEVLGKGQKPDGSDWLVGIENPSTDSLSERTLNARVKLSGKALATSGSYRKYYEENGVRYSHTIDPKTGYPVRHSLLSVSVLAGDCATADGYATAFMVMGFEKAKDFVENEPELEAYFINASEDGLFETYATKGFMSLLISD
ncbi:MAG: FAD:protein FMN transferase [Bacteroidales bacterium]|jgi:thiamine biosynthesis lipoprotein|nr:FAD:protein FMN transferase [Bacteroidales bacterium]